jgi:hypothetical protein
MHTSDNYGESNSYPEDRMVTLAEDVLRFLNIGTDASSFMKIFNLTKEWSSSARASCYAFLLETVVFNLKLRSLQCFNQVYRLQLEIT